MLVLGAAGDDGREFVAGGYAASSWTSDVLYVADPESARSVGRGSFLFSLVDAAGHWPVQLRLKNPADRQALCIGGIYGPTFGGGYDLLVGSSGGPLNGTNSSYTATSRSGYSSYDATAAAAQGCITFRGADHPQAGSYYLFTTKELEVFALQ